MDGSVLVGLLEIAALVGPPVAGFVVGRYRAAFVLTAALVVLASFWPESSDVDGDDWRPVIFPVWLALELMLAACGVAIRQGSGR